VLTHLDQPGISTARQEVSAAGPNVQGCALGVETPNDSKRGGPRPASQARSYTLICEEPVIILNGGSSSGKSGIARCLQAVPADPWLVFGIGSFVDALPARMQASDKGIVFAADGGVSVGADFRALEAAWMEGIAVMARAGARIIIDDVILSERVRAGRRRSG
jgi:chloramphenicol 3-O-phosphotransferase